MEMSWDEINIHINRNGTEILRRLVPLIMSADVLKQLVQEEVLLDHQELSLRYIDDPAKRCTTFMDILKGGSMEMYYSLIKVVTQNKQTDLVKLLDKKQVMQDQTGMTTGDDVSNISLTEEQVERFMDDKGYDIERKLRPHMGPPFLANLLKGKAITNEERGEIKNKTDVNGQLEKLMEFVRDAEKFNNFRRVLRERKMKFLDQEVTKFMAE